MDRGTLTWIGGALLVVVAVVAWILLGGGAEDLLPQQYRYGIL